MTTWGANIVFSYRQAQEQGIVDPDTPTLQTVKNSPTNPKLSTRETKWGLIQDFTTTQYVQFPEGDPAYAAVMAWSLN